MFDIELPESRDVAALDAAGLIDAVVDLTKMDSVVQARRLAAVGELWDRRKREASPESEFYLTDVLEEVSAELGAALHITSGRAKGLIRLAEALRDRLPTVAAAFGRGEFDTTMVSSIVYRTDLIADPDLLAKVDAAVAARAPQWAKYPRQKIAEYIDSWVARFDPAGKRAPREPQQRRHFDIFPAAEGMAALSGTVRVSDAVVLDERLDQLIATVCPHDVRSKDQLRADALRALAQRDTQMACECSLPGCDGQPPKPLGEVIVHVLAESATVQGTSDTPGYVAGFGPINAHTVRELAQHARIKPLTIPQDTEAGYRPSAALADFVRWRDLTCRFPGCDAPAEVCDVDHTQPYPFGATHPSNTKLYCRTHHLLKTFSTGWNDRQFPDGTIEWTSPTGHTYTTKPAGSLFFPALATPTGDPPPHRPTPKPHPQRMAMMPTRQRTRADERAYRLALERAHNTERITRWQSLLSDLLKRDTQPPPF